MISREENKSKFSFASLISKAYNNILGVAVSYASPSYNSFSNAINGIYNFTYKNFFLSKFDESYEFSKSAAHNIVINILKTIPTFNGYFSYMSKAKAEQEIDIKSPDTKINDSIPLQKNISNLSAQIGFIINLNLENADSQIELPKNPEVSNISFERIISEENADQSQYQNTDEQQLSNNNSNPFAGWGASHSLFNLGPPPKLYSGSSRVSLYNWNQLEISSNLLKTPEVMPYKSITSDDKYISQDYASPALSGTSSQYEENPDHPQDKSLNLKD